LGIAIWNLFGPILRSGGACNLLFPVYPGTAKGKIPPLFNFPGLSGPRIFNIMVGGIYYIAFL
jgi:hypothetical protein